MRPLAEAKTFPLTGSALATFVLLKSELCNSALQSITVDKLIVLSQKCVPWRKPKRFLLLEVH